MARPREFDTDVALEDAMRAFWQNGYNATSVSDLIAETGINRGSLYGTFGDKRQLFLAALERYDATSWAEIRTVLERPGPARAVLRDWMLSLAETCTGDAGRRGCLLAKAAMEVVHQDPEVAAFMRRLGKRNEDFLARVVARGQMEGEITDKLEARAIARFLWASLAGLKLMGATSPTPREVREVIDVILHGLDC